MGAENDALLWSGWEYDWSENTDVKDNRVRGIQTGETGWPISPFFYSNKMVFL